MSTKETHISCPTCPSSDAFTRYEDGHGYCYSCLTTFTKGDLERMFDNIIEEPIPNEVGKMDKAMDKVREAHGIVYQKGEHHEGHVYRAYHSDFVYRDHKDAYDEE